MSVKKTIAFFAIDQYPLFTSELHRFLFSPGIEMNMHALLEEGTIKEEDVSERMTRFFLSAQKMKKARRIAAWLVRFVPGIRMIAVCNHVAFFNASKESDIDLCIVTKKGFLYQTRFLTVLFLTLLGQRPSRRSRQDKICASFFLTEDALCLRPLQKEDPDVYLLYWIATVWPLYDQENTYERFWEQNDWIRAYLPHVQAVNPFERVHATSWILWSRFVGGCFPEGWCRFIQERRLPPYLREKCNKGTDVLMNDQYLKFHANDRRSWYFQEWKKRYE